jgi:copper chaperone NosL
MSGKVSSGSWIFIALVFFSCTPSPQPIAYGIDGCAYCEMIIMDPRYGTEMVTKKGKAYKFDSVECLVRYLKENESAMKEANLLLLTPFSHPETLEDAHRCTILHSLEIPSPMGMFLTAFSDEATAVKYRDDNGGTLYTWKELIDKFDSLNGKDSE